MNKRIVSFLALALALCLSLPAPSRAQGEAQSLSRLDRSERLVLDETGLRDLRQTSSGGKTSRVVIELADAPAVEVYLNGGGSSIAADPTSAAQAQLATIEQAQQQLVSSLSSMGAQVIYRTQRVYNGVAVQVANDKLAAIARLPGVKAIHPSTSVRRSNGVSVPFIGAPELWSTGPITATGKGMRIGIIDTGIDYIHTDFGGSGLQSDYTRNISTTIDESPALFPTAKVVGGYDFVGDSFDSTSDAPAAQMPAPDPDPMDCNGHGTHVAGTAAGFGVNSDGTTYRGPYTNSLNFSNFRIGPGVAPEASLYALKVFGCDGSSDVIAPAIDFAVDPNRDGNFSDRLDVINMSLGSSAGPNNDAQSVASNRAAALGVVVVASAGNEGDSYYITGSPGSADRVLTVAASVDSGITFLGIKVLAPASIAKSYQAAPASFGPPLSTTGITGTVAAAAPANGCAPLTNPGDIAGKIALIDRGVCNFTVKVKHAQDAGAIAVIIANNRPGDPTSLGGADPSITIPSVMISQADAATIRGKLGEGVQVTLSSAITVARPDLADTLASFSSRGPAAGSSRLKPDISAPGLGIVSAATGTGNEPLSLNGTSMAAPHVAGGMALLRQLHPTWSVEELKALAMNTATNAIRTAVDVNALPFGPGRVGTGRIDLPDAADATVVAYNDSDDGTVSISFGALEITRTTTLSKMLKIVNKGASDATYDLAYQTAADIPGVTYSLSSATVTVPANGSVDVTVTMSADPAQMKHTIDPSTGRTQDGQPRHWLSEAAGFVTLTPRTATFTASLSGANEVPPVTSPITAEATFVYTDSTRQLSYLIEFNQNITLNNLGGHLHRGVRGVNGPVVVPIAPGGATFGPNNPLSGTVTLTPTGVALLRNGALYANFHTAANPGGEIRGQVESDGPSQLRVPVHAAARPASQMRAVQTNLSFSGALTATTTISLTGTPLVGTNVPTDEVSVVTAFELQYTSPVTGSLFGRNADLRYVGVASSIRATATPTQSTGVITDTSIYFAIATHGDWNSPHQVEFDILIDVDRDGTDDFLLREWNLGTASGLPTNSVYVTTLTDLETGTTAVQDYLNGLPAAPVGETPGLNTVPFNTNVMVLPVKASDLGLAPGASRFNYRVVTYSSDRSDGEFINDLADYGDPIDRSPTLTYDAANPGFDLANRDLQGLPAYFDRPSTTITVRYNEQAYKAAGSTGLLLLHHHNTSGNRAEVVSVNVGSRIYLPIVMQKPATTR